MCFLKAINNILHGHNHKTPMTKCTHLIHPSIIKEHLEGPGDTSDDARIEIWQKGTLRHSSVNWLEVTQLQGRKLGFKPSCFGSKGCALNGAKCHPLNSATFQPQFPIPSRSWSKVLLKYRQTTHWISLRAIRKTILIAIFVYLYLF